MQKRLTRKLDLEMFLSQVEAHPSPSPNLEQYTISPDVAATMLYVAAYAKDDVEGKRVLDLGCGTGRLALGAAFLGAREVVGLDIDRVAVKSALKNSIKTGLKGKVQWIAASLNAVHGSFDTVLQNPPFGVQRRGADREFLVKALESSRVVYSLHKSSRNDIGLLKRVRAGRAGLIQVSPDSFLKRFIEENGGHIRAVYALVMTVPHMFDFHTERKHEFLVDLYVIERN